MKDSMIEVRWRSINIEQYQISQFGKTLDQVSTV